MTYDQVRRGYDDDVAVNPERKLQDLVKSKNVKHNIAHINSWLQNSRYLFNKYPHN